MALREDIQKRIEKKRGEIVALEAQIGHANVYIQALEDTLKLLPREAADADVLTSPGASIRPGSKVDKAREAIRKAGKPLHVSELVAAIGRPNDIENRAALAGSLSAYSRRREIFTKPAPNTFGLLELPKPHENGVHGGPPPNFGRNDLPVEEEVFPAHNATRPAEPMPAEGITDEDVPF